MISIVEKEQINNGEKKNILQQYEELGLPLVKLNPNRKEPEGGNGWQHRTCTDSRLWKVWLDQNYNVGIFFDARTQLIDVECDNPEAEEELKLVFGGAIPVTPTWESKRGKHRLFKWREGLPTSVKHIGKHKIEFRYNHQSVAPPSIAEDVERIWTTDLSTPIASFSDSAMEQLRRLDTTTKEPNTWQKTDGNANDNVKWAESFIEKHKLNIKSTSTYGDGFKYELEECPFKCHDSGGNQGAIFASSQGLGFKCLHGKCEEHHWKEFRDLFEPSLDLDRVEELFTDDEPCFDSVKPPPPQAPPQAEQTAERVKRGFRISQLPDSSKRRWAVKGHIKQFSITEIYGQWGVGKSFYGTDIVMSRCTGKPFLDAYDVVQGSCVYVCSEGFYGMKVRIDAWLKHYNLPPP